MMTMMDEKKYHIDGVPASATDIVELAESYSIEFSNDWIKQTSTAARILREHGHTVGNLAEVNK